MKACNKCGVISANFSKDKTKKDGFRTICRRCTAATRRERYARDPESRKRIQEWNETWRQRNREADLDAKRAYYAENKQEHYERVMRWRDRNPSVWRAISITHERKRRNATRNGVGVRVMSKWIRAQPKSCFYCQSECGNDFHVDHFVPLSKGGAHVLTNFRIACPACNLSKGARDPMEFVDSVNAAMFAEAA